MKKLLTVFVLLLALALVACGGTAEEAVGEGEGLGGREITVAVENAYLPFNYIDPTTGEPAG